MNKSITKILDRLAQLKHLPSEMVLDDPRDPNSGVQLPRQQLSLAPFIVPDMPQGHS